VAHYATLIERGVALRYAMQRNALRCVAAGRCVALRCVGNATRCVALPTQRNVYALRYATHKRNVYALRKNEQTSIIALQKTDRQ